MIYSLILSLVLSASAEPSLRLEEPTGTVTLSEALSAALLGNPGLAAYAWELRVTEALTLQAGLRPNPESSFEVEGLRFRDAPSSTTRSRAIGLEIDGMALSPAWEIGRERGAGASGAFDDADLRLALSQRIETGAKRARRVRLARAEEDLARWDYEAARADVLAETARRFIAVVVTQEQVALATDLHRLAEAVRDAVAAQVEAGKVAPLDLQRARTEADLAAIDMRTAQRLLDARRAALAATWGATEARFERADAVLDAPPPLPDLDSLRTGARAPSVPPITDSSSHRGLNPDVARWRSEIARREAALALARAQRAPDLTVSLGLRVTPIGSERHSGIAWGSSGVAFTRERTVYDRDADTTITLGVSVPLPLFDRNQGNIRAEEHRVAQASAQERAARVDAAGGIASAHHEAAARRDEFTGLRDAVLPELERIRALTVEGYEAGKFGYLDLVGVERDLFASRARALDALAAYHEAAITLERLSGLAIVSEDSNNTLPSEEASHAE